MGFFCASLPMFMGLLVLIGCLSLVLPAHSPASPSGRLCHDEEKDAMLRFKQGFQISSFASGEPFARPKLLSWNATTDCCLWDGVECDNVTGYTVGLDLGSSFLYGSINSSSALFGLIHLRTLNLADIDFNYSRIPREIANLSMLSALNISLSVFSGQVPAEFFTLSNLVSLDMSDNVDPVSYQSLLLLKEPGLSSLVQSLINLEQLYLNRVMIYSQVPLGLTKLTSLKALGLQSCGLVGEFPEAVFWMPSLKFLDLTSNGNLTGFLPEFPNSSNALKALRLTGTGFSGEVPFSLGNLASLNALDLSGCNFTGSLPDSLGNLTDLTYLALSSNNFTVPSLSWLGKLSKLRWLELIDLNLHGEIPPALSNLTQLTILRLRVNQFSGQVPSWLFNLTKLILLDVSVNSLSGPIPDSFSLLNNLQALDLSTNHFSGIVDEGVFLSLKALNQLRLSFNHISILTRNVTNSTSLPQLLHLELIGCNLGRFPDFLRFQDKLEVLLLDNSNITGLVPTWLWNVSGETLGTLAFASNSLTGFEENLVSLPGNALRLVDMGRNSLQGSLPSPPPNMFVYTAGDNNFSGSLSPLICNANSLYVLDVSNNSMSGTLPPCLSNFSSSLSVLKLQGNNFSGNIPQAYAEGCNLKMMDLSNNHFEGRLSRSLANCTLLQILDISDNQIQDTFPGWLGDLAQLQVLVMHSNSFYGSIPNPASVPTFPKLRIIDISGNGFEGVFPDKYFECWSAMKVGNLDLQGFMQATLSFVIENSLWDYSGSYSITLTNKGVMQEYVKILNIMVAVDLSDNNFSGDIPGSIGDLQGLQSLNLSYNQLTGPIPPSISNLTNLESLDLSRNSLSGGIPPQLAQLGFIAFLNVSYNHLTGPIPQGKQFGTFLNASYEGNSGLCGDPLSDKCRNHEPPSAPGSTAAEKDDSEFLSGIDWVVVCSGVVSGLIAGAVFGYHVTTRYEEWIFEKFGKRGQKLPGSRSTLRN